MSVVSDTNHLRTVLRRYRSINWQKHATIENIEGDIQFYNQETNRVNGEIRTCNQKVGHLESTIHAPTKGKVCVCNTCTRTRREISRLYNTIYSLREKVTMARQILSEANSLLSKKRRDQMKN